MIAGPARKTATRGNRFPMTYENNVIKIILNQETSVHNN